LTKEELKNLIYEVQSFLSEQDNIEVKAAAKGAPKIYDSLSSLSNRPGGGIIIFGLDEESDFKPVGVYNLEDLMKKVGEAAVQMEPPVRPTFTSLKLEGVTVLAAEIPECRIELKPCYYKPAGLHGGSYIRVADGDRKMTDYEIYMFVSSRGQVMEDLQPVIRAKPTDLDEQAIEKYLAKIKEKKPDSRLLALPREQLLKTLNILTEHEGSLVPTLAGMLMFGIFPQQFFPSLFVAFLMYAGTNENVKGSRGERFLDNRRIEGTIPEIVVEAEKAILHNMSRSTVVSGFMRNDIDEYPREAIREAVINALAHRDYSRYALGSHIQIRMFSDRLEIDNQGGLFGHLSEDSIGIEAPTARNAALMRMLEDMDIVENRGSGIRAMVEAMRSAHLAPPKFKNNHTSFKVTFYNHTLLDKETLEWLNRFNTIPLNDNQRFALAYLRRNPLAPKLTNRDYQRINSVDSVQATKELGDMVKRAGVLVQNGTRGGAYYTLSEMVLEKQQTEFFPAPLLKDNEAKVIDYIKKNGFITNSLCRELLGIGDKDAANYLLTNMFKKNLVKRTGRGKGTKYTL
jgi:ATP-dependent DNA helicase RecG